MENTTKVSVSSLMQRRLYEVLYGKQSRKASAMNEDLFPKVYITGAAKRGANQRRKLPTAADTDTQTR